MKNSLALLLITLLIISSGNICSTFAQNRAPQTPAQSDDDTVRINTNLVQTDVSVFDRKGNFVGNLQQGDFELKVDGKPQPLSFFERIGASDSATQTAASSVNASSARDALTARAPIAEQPRLITFFVDDLHLTPETVARSRQALLNFIDKQMTPGTQAMIVAASGRTGFLAQPTEDVAALKAAVKRITYQTRSTLSSDRPVMSEFQALAIERGDREALAYQVQQFAYQNGGGGAGAENVIKNRARIIRRQAAILSRDIVSNLEAVMRSFSPSPARRVVFFISNGFAIDSTEGDIIYRLRRVTDQAARRNVVIYTLDARGLEVGMLDASSDAVSDIANTDSSFLPNHSLSAEISASQEVLRTLAADTGGRALLNNNALESLISGVVNETSNYYLLGWRPEAIDERTNEPKFRRIEISIKGRPELKVRARRGFFNRPVRDAETANANHTTSVTPNAALNSALNALYQRRDIPVALYAAFANDAQSGLTLNAAVQLTSADFDFAETATTESKRRATVNLACVVVDESGKTIYSTGRDMQITASSNANEDERTRSSKFISGFAVPVTKPGLYQFRVAARDAQTGRVGTAFQWIDVPEFKPGKVSLGSLLISEQPVTANIAGAPASSSAANSAPTLDIAREFRRTSRLLLQVIIYNAAQGSGNGAAASPDVMMELQVKGGDKVVLSAPSHAVALSGVADMMRIPYAAAIPLRSLTPGVYALQLTVTDRIAHRSATRKIDFTVQ